METDASVANAKYIGYHSLAILIARTRSHNTLNDLMDSQNPLKCHITASGIFYIFVIFLSVCDMIQVRDGLLAERSNSVSYNHTSKLLMQFIFFSLNRNQNNLLIISRIPLLNVITNILLSLQIQSQRKRTEAQMYINRRIMQG